jgi:hypothetical protein
MSLARVCDRCGHGTENTESMMRVKLQSYNEDFTSISLSHLACADICIGCCRELFNSFIGDDDWNDILHSGVDEEEDKE